MSTTKQPEARQSFQNLPLNEQIRRALPIARDRIVGGIDSPRHTEMTIVDRVVELLRRRQIAAARAITLTSVVKDSITTSPLYRTCFKAFAIEGQSMWSFPGVPRSLPHA